MMKMLLRQCSRGLPKIAARLHSPELLCNVEPDLMNLGIVQPLLTLSRGHRHKSKESEDPPVAMKVPAKVLATAKALEATFFKNVVGSHRLKWLTILKEHPELKELRAENVKATVKMLKGLNFTAKDIMEQPQLLQSSAHVILNRYHILQECGFQNITNHLLAKYITAVNKSVRVLKSLGHIPNDLNVFQRLCSLLQKSIDLKINEQQVEELYHEDVPLKMIRQRLLSEYFRRTLKTSEKDLDKIWNTYARIKHRNFESLQQLLDIYINQIGFPVDVIIRNAYLLHANPDEVLKILKEVPSINNRSITEIVLKRPKILMSTSKTLKTSLKHIKDFGISQEALGRCLEVLTLSPETIRKRLEALQSVAEFKVLRSNPRLLRLVHHQTKAIRRLEYLSQMKIRCTSLHILSCASHSFDKFAKDGADRTRGRETVMYLCGVLGLDDQQHIRNILARHPYWCQIAPLCVQQCLEYLLAKGFSKEDVYRNLHILIYPISSIDEQLTLLNEKLELLSDEACIENISKSKILTLLLYFIESEHHFTGNGVWMDEHWQPVESPFNNQSSIAQSSHGRSYNYGLRTTSADDSIKEVQDSNDTHATLDSRRSVVS